jgi:hypothetical protein
MPLLLGHRRGRGPQATLTFASRSANNPRSQRHRVGLSVGVHHAVGQEVDVAAADAGAQGLKSRPVSRQIHPRPFRNQCLPGMADISDCEQRVWTSVMLRAGVDWTHAYSCRHNRAHGSGLWSSCCFAASTEATIGFLLRLSEVKVRNTPRGAWSRSEIQAAHHRASSCRGVRSMSWYLFASKWMLRYPSWYLPRHTVPLSKRSRGLRSGPRSDRIAEALELASLTKTVDQLNECSWLMRTCAWR